MMMLHFTEWSLVNISLKGRNCLQKKTWWNLFLQLKTLKLLKFTDFNFAIRLAQENLVQLIFAIESIQKDSQNVFSWLAPTRPKVGYFAFTFIFVLIFTFLPPYCLICIDILNKPIKKIIEKVFITEKPFLFVTFKIVFRKNFVEFVFAISSSEKICKI